MAMAADTGTIPPGMGTEHPLPDNGGSCLEKDSPAAMPTATDCQPYDRMAAFEHRQQETRVLISSLTNMVNTMAQQISTQSQLITLLNQQIEQHTQANKALQQRIDELEARQQLAERREESQMPATEKLPFNLDMITKKEIIMILVELDKKHAFNCTNKDLIQHMASRTNLGSVDTIRTQFYNYKKQV